MKLALSNSCLSGSNSNAIFRANHVMTAIKKWKLPDNLLDVGCGSGDLLRLAKAQGVTKVGGVDRRQEALDQCKDVGDQLLCMDLNISGLAIQENSFEVVTCLEVLEHLYAPQDTLKEIVRVTQPGGRVVVSVPNPFSYSARLRVLFGQNVSNPATIGGHIKFFRPADLKSMCESCGLQHVKIWGMAYPTTYSKYGMLVEPFLKWMPELFATWLFAFCEKPIDG